MPSRLGIPPLSGSRTTLEVKQSASFSPIKYILQKGRKGEKHLSPVSSCEKTLFDWIASQKMRILQLCSGSGSALANVVKRSIQSFFYDSEANASFTLLPSTYLMR